MAARRRRKRSSPSRSRGDRLLDAFFQIFSDEEGDKLAHALCLGFVTGADLARELDWTRDKVSRRTDLLEKGGVVEKRRDGSWVRIVPQVAGGEAAHACMAILLDDAPPSEALWPSKVERRKLASLLADRSQRSLLNAMHATPGATQAELVRACGLSQPTVSRGLSRLVGGGLAFGDRAGRGARYTLRAETIARFCAWLIVAKEKLAKGRETANAVVLRQSGASAPEAEDPSPPLSSTKSPSLRAEDGAATSRAVTAEEENVTTVPAAAGANRPDAANDAAETGPDGGSPDLEVSVETADVVTAEAPTESARAKAA